MGDATAHRGPSRDADALTARQRQVLMLLRRGLTNEEIARELGISIDGAKWHVSEIIGRLGVADRHEAARWREPGEPRRWWSLAALRELRWGGAAKVASGVLIAVVAAGVLLLAWGILRGAGGGNRSTAGPRTLIFAAGGGAIAVDTRTGAVEQRFGALKDLPYVIAPDGRRAAFACSDDASAYIGATDPALCVWDVASGPNVVVRSSELPAGGLLEDNDWSGSSAWSPDSSRIAFLVYQRAAPGVYSSGDVFVKDFVTGDLRRVDEGQFARSRSLMQWSPDSAHISMLEGSTLDARRDLLVIDVATGERHVLSESLRGDGGVEQHAWSADSRNLAFTRNEGQQSLYVAPANAASPPRRIASAWGGEPPAWSPDDEWIAATNVSGSRGRVFIIRVDGSDRREVDGGLASSGWPAWSPDGRRLAFAGTPRRDAFNARLYVYDLAGATATEVPSPPLAFAPVLVWAPDGQRIFVTAGAGACMEGCPPGYLYMLRIDGGASPLRVHDEYVGALLGAEP